jgi:hypothetical protein
VSRAKAASWLAVSLVGLAFAVGACSSDNNGGANTKKDAAPGDAATTDGAAGSTGDGASTDAPPLYDSGGEAGPVSCGSATCQPEDFRGLATLHACCTQDTSCGLDLGPAQKYVAAPDGCVARDNPGIADTACPSYDAPSLGQLAGCCRSDHTCGVFVKLSSSLDLGCVAAAGFAEEAGSPASCNPDAGNDSGTFDAHTTPGDAGDAASSDAQTPGDAGGG